MGVKWRFNPKLWLCQNDKLQKKGKDRTNEVYVCKLKYMSLSLVNIQIYMCAQNHYYYSKKKTTILNISKIDVDKLWFHMYQKIMF